MSDHSMNAEVFHPLLCTAKGELATFKVNLQRTAFIVKGTDSPPVLLSAERRHESRKDPLQQERGRPDPCRPELVHSWRREEPVPVPELPGGPGGVSGRLWLVRSKNSSDWAKKRTSLNSVGFFFPFSRWVANTYSSLGGKPLWIDPFDQQVQHIFIDDNIRQNDEDTVVNSKVRALLLKDGEDLILHSLLFRIKK